MLRAIAERTAGEVQNVEDDQRRRRLTRAVTAPPLPARSRERSRSRRQGTSIRPPGGLRVAQHGPRSAQVAIDGTVRGAGQGGDLVVGKADRVQPDQRAQRALARR
jgi:hypothetical protein